MRTSRRLSAAIAALTLTASLAALQWSSCEELWAQPGGAVIKQGSSIVCGEINENGVPSVLDRPPCKLNQEDSARIVGGQAARPGQFPYQVSLIINQSILCSGVIIDHWHILTAAHCITKW